MPKYMLLMYIPPAGAPTETSAGAPKENWADQQNAWGEFVQGLKDAGVYLDNNSLAGTDVATTVQTRDGETLLTDGPFAETKEYLAGYFLIEADDLDTALKHAAQVPSAAWGSVEVRPLRES
jgi:hypothetical protein